MTGSVLIFSPHIDDEVLGCFAWLNKNTHVIYIGVEDRPGIPATTRLQEADASASALGFTWSLQTDQVVNQYHINELIHPMEQAIEQHRPDTVLLPEPSYNQDHRAVHDAGMVALRPHDLLHPVPVVLLYEQPHSVIWPWQDNGNSPTAFVEIDIDAKLEAYALYASQVRAHRSPETLRSLAGLRGTSIGCPAAEAFHVRHWQIGPDRRPLDMHGDLS